jgi:hypothetical protein
MKKYKIMEQKKGSAFKNTSKEIKIIKNNQRGLAPKTKTDLSLNRMFSYTETQKYKNTICNIDIQNKNLKSKTKMVKCSGKSKMYRYNDTIANKRNKEEIQSNIKKQYLKEIKIIKNDLINNPTNLKNFIKDKKNKKTCILKKPKSCSKHNKNLQNESKNESQSLSSIHTRKDSNKNNFKFSSIEEISCDNDFQEFLLLNKIDKKSEKYLSSLRYPLEINNLQTNFENYIDTLQKVVSNIFQPSKENDNNSKKVFAMGSIHLEKRSEQRSSSLNKKVDLKRIKVPDNNKNKNKRKRGNQFNNDRKKLQFRSEERDINNIRDKTNKYLVKNVILSKEFKKKSANKKNDESIHNEHRLFIPQSSNSDSHSSNLSYVGSTNDRENANDLDGLNLKETIYLPNEKIRLFHINPLDWQFQQDSFIIKQNTESDEENGIDFSSSFDVLLNITLKIWWEEYIPFNLFNQLNPTTK